MSCGEEQDSRIVKEHDSGVVDSPEPVPFMPFEEHAKPLIPTRRMVVLDEMWI